MNKFLHGLRESKNEDLKSRVVNHKERFIKLFEGRYRELLPSLIVYKNNDTGIDFLKVENALRNGYQVVIGENVLGVLCIFGYVNTTDSIENPNDLLSQKILTKDDITFTIHEKLIPPELKEISRLDNCTTGNFVVLRNKTLNYVNDLEIVRHYTDELSEIVLSRFSLAMQAKINTFLIGDIGDETINQIAQDLYNGSPYVKVSTLFDVKDNIYTFNNQNLSTNFAELKREYQNKISELNNMLGINSLAVEKASGVSDTEAKSNRSYTVSNSNIFLEARNNPLKKLNKRYEKNIEAIYNDEVSSELANMFNKKEVFEND